MKPAKEVAIFLVLLLFPLSAFSQNSKRKDFVSKDGTVYLEDFESDAVGELPENWFNRNGKAKPRYYKKKDKKNYHYKIVEENDNRFLRFEGDEAKHLNLPIGKSKIINIKETPVLSWRWRAVKIPAGANENRKKKNDVVLSVYVVFKVTGLFKLPQSIRYTWSSTLEPGKVLTKFGGRQKIVVLESGEQNLGIWQSIRRNIYEDYKKLFGKRPPTKPLAILLLSDGDSTDQQVSGDYDDFALTPAN